MENKDTPIVNTVGDYRLSREEQETVIYYDFARDVWIADTSIQRDINKFRKQGWKETYISLYDDGSICSIICEAPRSAITIGRAVREKRIMTEEQRNAARDRLTKMRNKNKV